MSVADDEAIIAAVITQMERIEWLRAFDAEAARQLGALSWMQACVWALNEAVEAQRWDSVRERMAMLREAAAYATWRPEARV